MLVALSIERPTSGAVTPPLADVGAIGRIEFSGGPLLFVGYVPGSRLTATGLPWVRRRVAVVWGEGEPACIIPCRGRKPMGNPAVDTPRLGSSVLTLSELDGPRVDVATHDRRWSIVRARRLEVTVVDGRGETLLVDSNRRTQVDIDASHDDLKVAIALWAADQTRAVWSFWRHIANGI